MSGLVRRKVDGLVSLTSGSRNQALSPMLGNNPSVLAAAVNDAMMQALASSNCKGLLSLPDGEYSEIMLPLGHADSEFRGTRCYMNLEGTVPELRSLLTPPDFCHDDIDRVNAYLSPAGAGTPLHFDTRNVLIVQLVGTKLWQVSKRPAVANAHRNCVAQDGAEWVNYDGVRLRLPSNFLFVMLNPGDWLLVPKATWHSTFTSCGSISATLAAPPTSDELQ